MNTYESDGKFSLKTRRGRVAGADGRAEPPRTVLHTSGFVADGAGVWQARTDGPNETRVKIGGFAAGELAMRRFKGAENQWTTITTTLDAANQTAIEITQRPGASALNRDPIGERGAVSLSLSCSDQPLDHVDVLGLKDKPSYTCCTEKMRIQSMKELQKSYKDGVAGWEKEDKKRMFEAVDDPEADDWEKASCHNINGNILRRMGRPPPCRTCWLENRKYASRLQQTWNREEDHWVIICAPVNQDGKFFGGQILFDNTGGQRSPEGFRTRWPILVGKEGNGEGPRSCNDIPSPPRYPPDPPDHYSPGPYPPGHKRP